MTQNADASDAHAQRRARIEASRDGFLAAVNTAAGGRVFYVQVGAHDGRMADPVFATAKENGWHGLLIEPHPAYFAALQHRYRNRKGFALRQLGISDTEGVLPLYHLDEALAEQFPRWVQGCASLDRRRVVQQVKVGCTLRGLVYRDDMVAQTDVALRRLDSVLAEENIRTADLLVIDVEGHELPVMASADLAALSLRGMLVECNGINATQKPDYVAALQCAGMTVYELGEDLCGFDPTRLTVNLAAEFDTVGLPRLVN